MKISIIGSGVVGKVTGVGFHRHGNDVLFCDADEEKLVMIRKQGYAVAENISEAVINSTVSFVCVQTPTVDGRMNFSYVERAATDIAKALREKGEYHVVVMRSTILPSYTRTKVVPILERYSMLKVGKDIGVCVNPEFLREASALDDFLNSRRIVIGEFDRRSGDVLEELYSSFKAPKIRVDLDTAEMIKYAANAFLSTKISFFNEIYMICESLGLNARVVAEAVALDPRIGTYGIYGGRPFGGNCLPKDLEAFTNFVKGGNINPKLLEAVIEINKEIVDFMKMKTFGGKASCARLAFLSPRMEKEEIYEK